MVQNALWRLSNLVGDHVLHYSTVHVCALNLIVILQWSATFNTARDMLVNA